MRSNLFPMRILSAVVLSAAFLASAHMTETQDVNSPASQSAPAVLTQSLETTISTAPPTNTRCTPRSSTTTYKQHKDVLRDSHNASKTATGSTLPAIKTARRVRGSGAVPPVACSAPQSEGAATKGTAGPDARPDSPSLRDMSGATRRRATARAISMLRAAAMLSVMSLGSARGRAPRFKRIIG
ncbi:hypothetical protein JR316_0007677 [Psilocybe cubensis]|uniref:Uncharacterized protein n=1 Tax=Psilocybe cubensis TaxID=181762 RepID=A0ACB8GU94_PSICU|nr:hypothetical protein JR316_0007677 [Psilocybe cubensis]KAH9479098.1 hypothetical protein JR316_0007677 [Psilocybe cubensis]